MGWLFTLGQTRKELIKARTTGWATKAGSSKCLVHCTRGNVLWSVWEIYRQSTGQIERVISCDLMQKSDGWGYKDLLEVEYPLYFTCPLKYLKMVPHVQSKEWREGVKSYHANK